MITNLPRPDVVLFDWDNTLANTQNIILEALKITLDKYDYQLDLDDNIAKHSRSLKEYFPEIFQDRWQEVMKYFYDTYEDLHKSLTDGVEVLEGAHEVLKSLHENEVPMGVISNKTPKYLHSEIEALNIKKYFYVVLGSGDTSKDKPSPDPIYHALSLKSHQPSKNIWYVGDSVVDYHAAVNAQCQPILIGSIMREFEDKGAIVFDDLTTFHKKLCA